MRLIPNKHIKPFILSGFIFFASAASAQSPGSIAKQSVWLHGNSTDVAPSQWLNFHPALATNEGSNRMKLPRNMRSLQRVTIFTVYQTPPVKDEIPLWEITGDFGDLSLTTHKAFSKSAKTTLDFVKGKPPVSGAVIHTYSGNAGGAATEDAQNQAPSISFGKWQALVSEFIVYEKILSGNDINKVETYLALKYGITLEKNYLNAAGKVVWNGELDKDYSNNIAGIARDDRSALYQKQGTSANSAGELVIGIDKIAPSNHKNTGRINDKDYLIWGDNAKQFAFRLNAEKRADNMLLPEKQWLMRSSGRSTNKLATGLALDTKTLLAGEMPLDALCLVIDRTGTGAFAAENCTYIQPDLISPEGIASFSGIHWDTDGSGKDVFTFGIRPKLNVPHNSSAANLTSFQLYPNPVTNGHYKMTLTLDKPSDIQVNVYDLHQRLIYSKKGTGQSSYLFTGQIKGAAGSYTVRIITPETEYSRIIIVQ